MKREEILKVAKPILFNTEMVQAILEGRKTATRRVIKYYGRTPTMNGRDKFYKINENLNGTNPNRLYAGFYNDNDVFEYKGETIINAQYYPLYFKVGDILYVKEPWKEYEKRSPDGLAIEKIYGYKTDENNPNNPSEFYEGKWKPSIHMPKKIARIFLKVTDIRVERLHDITVGDIENEGYPGEIDFSTIPVAMQGIMFEWWASTWNSTIKKQDLDRYGLKANPWVWVIEFERVEVN